MQKLKNRAKDKTDNTRSQRQLNGKSDNIPPQYIVGYPEAFLVYFGIFLSDIGGCKYDP